jgi:phenylacetate-CoA ligase
VTNAEPLFDYQRQTIAEAFQCPVRDTYGMAELVAAGSECPSGTLHLWPEVGLVDVDGRTVAGADGAADLVCTGLLNFDMPLIRYRIGDRGHLPSTAQTCDCGRTLPVLPTIEGRMDDYLYSSDGRRVGRLDPVFKAQLPIVEAQIVQESLHTVRVRYVPTEGFNRNTARLISDRLQERLGAVNVVLDRMDHIPRQSNGKFRAVVCALTTAERERLDAVSP